MYTESPYSVAFLSGNKALLIIENYVQCFRIVYNMLLLKDGSRLENGGH